MYPNSNSKLLGLHWLVTGKVTELLFFIYIVIDVLLVSYLQDFKLSL
jgi:hypothetical protein